MAAVLELEASASAAEVLGAYDATADRWTVSLDSSFWKAVRHAHGLGRKGAGKRVAIIDSGCDLNYARLKQRVDRVRSLVPGPGDADPLGHGTAVALLITEVAPECRLDIYRVTTDEGKSDEFAAIDAIEEAAVSDAAVINLSLGIARPFPVDERLVARLQRAMPKRDYLSEADPCGLCKAADAAAQAGKLVFAAVGNKLLDAYCPARAPGVFAIGFQEEKTASPAPGKQVTFLAPVLQQALFSDLMLRQPDGVLGSSFACPLYAGIGALGITREELWAYVASYARRAAPLMMNANADTGGMAVPLPVKLMIDEGYQASMRELPHAHCSQQRELTPHLAVTDPADCAFCGIFADLQCVHYGFWLAKTRRIPQGIDLLSAMREFAPWSAAAAAYLGGAYSHIGDIGRAIENLEIALRLRPNHPDYVKALAQLQRMPRRRIRELVNRILLRVLLGR